eukprot:jgi/Mesvir1/19075/Mv12831-RA.1
MGASARLNLWTLLVALASMLFLGVDSVTFMIPPKSMECFTQHVKDAGVTIEVAFVASSTSHFKGHPMFGKTHDNINVLVYNPDGMLIHEETEIHDHVFDFVAYDAGVYKLCLDNSGENWNTEKKVRVVSFGPVRDRSILNVEPMRRSDVHSVQQKIEALALALSQINLEQAHARALESHHFEIASSLQSSVLLWAAIECGTIFAVSAVQIYLFLRHFNRKQTSRSGI